MTAKSYKLKYKYFYFRNTAQIHLSELPGSGAGPDAT